MVKHKNILFSLAGVVLLLFSIGLQAAGLGKLTLLSALGQPFQAEIDLVAVPTEELAQVSARVASPDAYKEANIEYVGAVGAIKFSVEQRPNGQAYLKASSTQPINEPFLELLIEVIWPSGKLLREYPILLDPPEVRAERTAPAEQPSSPAPAVPPSEEKPAAAPAEVSAEQARPVQEQPQPRSEETYGPVKRGETLGRIARALRPADVDLDQMLVALYRENRGAFIGKNMNLLKTGQMLKVPDLEEIKNVSAAEARREIRSHTKRWTDYRARLASNVAKSKAQAEPATQAAAGEVTAKATEEAKPETEGKDTLKLSKGQGPGDKVAAGEDPKAVRDRLNTLQEEATARENALKEANSRVVELEKTVQNLQKLLEMKSETLAQQPPAPTPPTAQAPQEPGATPPAPSPAQPPAAEQPKPQPAAPPKRAPVAAAPEQEPSLMDSVMGAIGQAVENPVALGGVAAALVAGVGGLWLVRKRRERQLGAFSATGAAASSSTIPASTDKKSGLVETSESAFLSEFNKVAPGSAEADEVDPVAEADVYLAYGRDAQAEEILKEAMARDSQRHEIAVKLLEIYAGRKSVGAFESIARQLHSAIGESHPLWTRVAEMGRGIDPGNALYGAAAAAAVGAFSESPAEKTNVVRFPERVQANEAPLDLSTGAKNDASRSTPGNLDFDLSFSEMGKQQASSAAAPDSVELEVPAAGAGGGAVDFDFDSLGRGSGEAANDAVKPASSADPFAIDVDLEKTAARSMIDLPEDAMQRAEETTRMATPPAFGSKPAGGGVDLSRINLNLDTPGSSVATTNVGSGSVSEAALRTVATKLDLAKAYLELGDKQGAKEILDEVIKEGSSTQQQEARKLAEQL